MTVNELLETVQLGERTVFDLADAAGGGKKLEVLIQKQPALLSPPPRKRESDARAHVFFSTASFAAYLEKYGTKDAVVFADPAAGEMHAVLDENAKEGKELLLFKPLLHPLWAPWETLLNRQMELSEFVEFLLNNRRVIAKPDARELVYSLSQIKATTHTEVQRGRGKQSMNGVMIKSTIEGVVNLELVELPETLEIATPLYVRTKEQEIEIDLCIEGGGAPDEIRCSLASGGILDAKVDAFEEMLEAIENHAGLKSKNITVTLGKPQFARWKYLDIASIDMVEVTKAPK